MHQYLPGLSHGMPWPAATYAYNIILFSSYIPDDCFECTTTSMNFKVANNKLCQVYVFVMIIIILYTESSNLHP